MIDFKEGDTVDMMVAPDQFEEVKVLKFNSYTKMVLVEDINGGWELVDSSKWLIRPPQDVRLAIELFRDLFPGDPMTDATFMTTAAFDLYLRVIESGWTKLPD